MMKTPLTPNPSPKLGEGLGVRAIYEEDHICLLSYEQNHYGGYAPR
jgi:hypothetical protein